LRRAAGAGRAAFALHDATTGERDMTLQKQLGFWLAAFAAFGLTVYVLAGVLLPFVAGLALAYLLDPLARRLERLGVSRLVATIVILSAFVLLFVLALVLLAPVLAQQLSAFIARLPAYVTQLQALASERGGPLLERLGMGGGSADAQKLISDFAGQAAQWVTRVAQSALAGGQAIAGILSLLVITPVVAFYLLVDWDRMVATIDSWLPLPQRDTIRRLIGQMDGAISGFLRGQSLVCLLLGSYYAIGLWLMGLNFGVLIGLVSGVLSFIPYIGSITGLLLAVGVATVQFWPDWTMPVIALAIFASGQFIEGNILSPKLVGEAVGLHPVWLMFALVAFGSLFGFVGLLLAVPLAAVVGVLARFAVGQYLASPLYSGGRRMIVERSDD
jgi:predicted PurR-regulated permease PerM